MRPAGLSEIERARKDGRWDKAYAAQSTAQVPDDLGQALSKSRKAKAFFDTLDSHNRYAILHRIHNAKKPETRSARIEKFVAMLIEGKTLHPMRTKAPKRPAKKSDGLKGLRTDPGTKNPFISLSFRPFGAKSPPRPRPPHPWRLAVGRKPGPRSGLYLLKTRT